MFFGLSNYFNVGPTKPTPPNRKKYGKNEEDYLSDYEEYEKAMREYEEEKDRMSRRRKGLRNSNAQLSAGMIAAGGGC